MWFLVKKTWPLYVIVAEEADIFKLSEDSYMAAFSVEDDARSYLCKVSKAQPPVKFMELECACGAHFSALEYDMLFKGVTCPQCTAFDKYVVIDP